ncbi:glutamate--tRNA ligase [Clostridium sp. CAG:1193]|nr:glutamate--tRNA ligase [Clostridium sp. CAG:1193]
MTNEELANLIFPNITKTIEDYDKIYPKRNLKEGAIVTRYAPSPTGFIHIGALLATFTETTFARQTDGVCFLRIEDTDTKRTVDNGISEIINGLKEFNVTFDEGPINDKEEIGNYGPYIQSERKEIYQAFVKHLIKEGKAYPCFCTEDELKEIRESQELSKARIGYYGDYAKCRNLENDEYARRIIAGEPYIIRLRSNGDYNKKIICHDEIKGDIAFPENDLDIVINKSDGLPTYHFAHLVDDYLMRTTHIIRADEWVSSLPLHYQLFQMFGFKVPKYAHIAPLAKIDEETHGMRKLSKRKDPECAMSYYHKLGIPYEAVRLYLATITSSGFEEWYLQNPNSKIEDYKFEFKKIGKSPALFDLEKLYNISKNYISRLTASDLYERVKAYLSVYDKEFYNVFTKDSNYSISILNIERLKKKPRKDIGAYSDVKKETWYMYDELFHNLEYSFDKINDIDEIKKILSTYINKYYVESDDKETWFDKIKLLCDELGYASDMKEYKNNPDNYKGSVADVSTVIRVVLTTKTMTPDLYEIMQILGKDRILKRFDLI